MGPPSPVPQMGPQAPQNSPSVWKMLSMGTALSPEIQSRMNNAYLDGQVRDRMQGPPAPTALPAPGPTKPTAQTSPFMAMSVPGEMSPNAKAVIDALTGARVHKDLSGRVLGQQGIDPNLKYLLYAMRGRRHKSLGGQQDVY